MAKKAFEVSFKLGGTLASSFSSAFSSASSKMDGLKNKSKELKQALRQLDSEHKRGKISAEQYAQAEAKLTQALEKNIRAQQRLAERQKRINALMEGANNARQTAASRAATIVPLTLAGAAIGGTAVSSINKAMNFEAQLDSIQAFTGITDQQLQKVRASALENGAATKYSALEAAQGFEELLKAGVSLDTALNSGLNASLNLATAGGLELAESAEFIADALNGFKKDGMSAADAANILSGAASASSTGVREMGFGLSAVGPVADGLGTSFKEVNATLALFSNNALKGSDAGTSFKTLLSNLIPKTDKATAAFKKFGLINEQGKNILFESNGELKDMAEVAEILQQRFKNLNAQQRQDVFYEMFGSDAIRAANILFKEGGEGVKKMYDEMSKVTALDVAKQEMDNAAGAVEQLKGAFETMQIVGAEALNPVIKKVALSAADLLTENQPAIEAFGKKTAKAIDLILEPFTVQKPVFDSTRKNDPEYMKQYNRDMAKYMQFKDMDFGDKVIYALDTMAEKAEAWVDGEGGETFGRIFTKLAEISMTAYTNALQTTAVGAFKQLWQGNFAAAGGLGTLAWIMGGGLLAKGAWSLGKGVRGAGKWGYDKYKDRKGGKAIDVPIPNGDSNKQSKSQKKKERQSSYGKNQRNKGKAPKKSVESATEEIANKKTVGKLGKAASGLSKFGKVLGPLAFVGSALSISSATDKTKETAKQGGALIGGLTGAKVLGAIGTAIAPGIGTAIGGAIGGVGGAIFGSGAGGKAVDWFRGEKSPEKTAAASTPAGPGQQTDLAALNANIAMTTRNFQLLAMYAGQASGYLASLMPIQGSAAMVVTNLTLLTSYAGQASGWLASLFPVQSSAAFVVTNLNLLTSYAGQASGWLASLFPVQTSAGRVISNLNILTSYVGQASGWIVSINGIQSSASAVKTALNNLASRINSVPAPKIPSAGATAGSVKPEKKFARGGFVNRPLLGLMGEAGPEANIPIRKNNSRSLWLWEETGRRLGVSTSSSQASATPQQTAPIIQLTYAPQVSASDMAGVEEYLQDHLRQLESMLTEVTRQGRRTAYD